MVTKSKRAGAKKKGKVNVLKLNKETVKDLTGSEQKGVKGGILVSVVLTLVCPSAGCEPPIVLKCPTELSSRYSCR